MESAAVVRSLHYSVGSISSTRSVLKRRDITSSQLNAQRFTVKRKGTIVSCLKTSETTLPAKSDNNNPQGPLEKSTLWKGTFPSGFEELILEVCDATEVAELKLKVGDFEMHLKRDVVGATKSSFAPVLSPTTPPPIPTKPMIESAASAPPATPPKPVSEKTSPFINLSSESSSKLDALKASGATGYVLVSSPTVGSFRKGRTLKGKKQPPICKEGDLIKEGQVIGYLDQFGTELPVKSDVAGEVLKVLFNEGEAVGYGDSLLAVLPSFHGIK